MKVNILVNKKNEVIGYREYPFDPTKPTIELEEFPNNLVVGEYLFENNKIVKKTTIQSDISPKYSKEILIKAFMEYRNDVNYGLVTENGLAHQEMIDWYKAINNNDINSMNHPPQIILKYLEDNSWI